MYGYPKMASSIPRLMRRRRAGLMNVSAKSTFSISQTYPDLSRPYPKFSGLVTGLCGILRVKLMLGSAQVSKC